MRCSPGVGEEGEERRRERKKEKKQKGHALEIYGERSLDLICFRLLALWFETVTEENFSSLLVEEKKKREREIVTSIFYPNSLEIVRESTTRMLPSWMRGKRGITLRSADVIYERVKETPRGNLSLLLSELLALFTRMIFEYFRRNTYFVKYLRTSDRNSRLFRDICDICRTFERMGRRRGGLCETIVKAKRKERMERSIE